MLRKLSFLLFSLAWFNLSLTSYAYEVPLTQGRHMNWIDRIQIPDYARDFYDQLVEASDGDGTDDWLIDCSIAESIEEGYGIPVTEFSGNASDEEEMEQEIADKQEEINAVIRSVYDAFDRDHPEVFWLSGAMMSSYSGTTYMDYSYRITYYFVLDTGEFDVRDTAYLNPERILDDIDRRDLYVDSILEYAGENEKEQVEYFNAWLTEFNGYNTQSIEEGNCDEAASQCLVALEGNFGEDGPICGGYAKAFKVLCDAAGIPSCISSGQAMDEEGNADAHVWNLVKIEDLWYGVDVTFNDPLVNGEDTDGVTDYLLVRGDTEINGMDFEISHQVDNQLSKKGAAFINEPEI